MVDAYLPGHPPARPEPLARFLPPIPDGVAGTWLRSRLAEKAEADEHPWVLDPFGTSPRLALELARLGYRVLVAANNPIARFLIEAAAAAPSAADLQAALADLAVSRRGNERLETHIRELYRSTCDACGAPVEVEAFLWERGATGALHSLHAGQGETQGLAPYARIYQCPACNHSGEHPTRPEDTQQAAQFAGGGLHRARALERVAAQDDPDRFHAEEALDTYLPRTIYALFTLLNRLDGLALPPERHDWLAALLLVAFDQTNTLWPHPTGRARPRQLTVPPRFREQNVWLALENAIEVWASDQPALPLARWPALPPAEGGLCVYEGRMRDLVENLNAIEISAVVCALPRPNQAFWTLSALWAGWLWGQEAAAAFKPVLRRRRYDWTWHTAALHAALERLQPRLAPKTPFLGLIGEAEPGFLSAAVVAADQTGFDLGTLALRQDSSRIEVGRGEPLRFDSTQAQISWIRSTQTDAAPVRDAVSVARKAARGLLSQRGEPASYLLLHAAALQALGEAHAFATSGLPPSETQAQVNNILEEAFSYRAGFLRFGGSEKSLEVGLWWAKDLEDAEPPLADRVEMALVPYLLKHPGARPHEVDAALCQSLPGLLAPSAELVHICLESYLEADPSGSGAWQVRAQDHPRQRRADLEEIYSLLAQTAQRLNLRAEGRNPQVWRDATGEARMACYPIASAVIGEILTGGEYPPQRSLIVLPGGRANLVAYKLQHDPRLRQAVEQGWRFVKFRQVRFLLGKQTLDLKALDELLSQDSLTYESPQLRLL